LYRSKDNINIIKDMVDIHSDSFIKKSCGLFCAFFIPPLGVFWEYGCSIEFWLCVLLTCCGYIPGVIYACCVIAGDDKK